MGGRTIWNSDGKEVLCILEIQEPKGEGGLYEEATNLQHCPLFMALFPCQGKENE